MNSRGCLLDHLTFCAWNKCKFVKMITINKEKGFFRMVIIALIKPLFKKNIPVVRQKGINVIKNS